MVGAFVVAVEELGDAQAGGEGIEHGELDRGRGECVLGMWLGRGCCRLVELVVVDVGGWFGVELVE